MSYLLLAEKPSAAKNMASALGGMQGSYNGQSYKIQALFGHMMEFVEPHEMVSDREQSRFKSWEPGDMPWDITQLSWAKQPQKTKDAKGKASSKAAAIKAVKEAAKGMSAIVIATDKDPTGEGQLIGWEVIHAIGWTGPVKRMYFIDESDKELQKGFKNIVDLPKADRDGEYVKADVRSRFDFLTMQIVRLSTHAARNKGYDVKVVRQGRLKSVMTKLVADQLALVKAYKKKPYYEVKFKDDKGNTYTRKFEDGDDFRFDEKTKAEQDATRYMASPVVQDSIERKESVPGKLLDLGGLASILGAKGYKSKEILSTYQKMYEAKIVSYPRTEDKVISKEQFNEMLPLVDKIADVVGADKKLLTHRKPRPTHVKDGGAHGANRPGLVVPSSLDSLSSYGTSAKAIYELLAKNFLAMFGENYVYDSVKAHIKDYPAFTTVISISVSLGFKGIFDADSELLDEDDEKSKDSKGLGSTGKPFVAEGVNPKPPYPTHKWLEKQLSKYDVGTGATRVSTLSEITNGTTALMTDNRGKLDLTRTGEIAAALLHGTKIADPKVTENLYKSMKDAGNFKVKPHDILNGCTDLIQHDKEMIYRNAEKLPERVGPPDKAGVTTKVRGVYKPTGKEIAFASMWSGYMFTDAEITKLLNGETIEIEAVGKSGKSYQVGGKLAENEYKGKKFWGFTPEFKKASDYTIDTAPFPKEWSGYVFTKTDEKKLRAGEKIKIQAISAKTGKPFDVTISFGIGEYKGNKSWKIEPHFEDRPKASDQTRATCKFKAEFSGYTLTEDEIKRVRAGEKIMVTAKGKSGKKFNCTLSLELKEWEGKKFWGLEPSFS